jgi:hypothetical protein
MMVPVGDGFLCLGHVSVFSCRACLQWTNLGRFNTPNNGSSTLFWPQYSNATDLNLNISLPLSVSSGLKQSQCDFWDAVMAILR